MMHHLFVEMHIISAIRFGRGSDTKKYSFYFEPEHEQIENGSSLPTGEIFLLKRRKCIIYTHTCVALTFKYLFSYNKIVTDFYAYIYNIYSIYWSKTNIRVFFLRIPKCDYGLTFLFSIFFWVNIVFDIFFYTPITIYTDNMRTK